MKKIFSALLLIASYASYGQQPQIEVIKDKDYYLKKSKELKSTYWFLTGLGIGLVVVSGIMTFNSIEADVNGTGSGDGQYETAEIIGITGLGIVVASIPLMVFSHKNKKKAMSLSLEQRRIGYPRGAELVSAPATFLSLKINLGR